MDRIFSCLARLFCLSRLSYLPRLWTLFGLHLGLLLLFFSCAQNVYFISDPYWETVTDVSFMQMRVMALRSGVLLNIVTTSQETPWLRQSGTGVAEGTVVVGLKNRIDDLLNQGNKVILSPYWLRNVEEQPPHFSQGQLVLIDAVSRNSKIQSVQTDMAAGWRKIGEAAGEYMRSHREREQAIAMFYRGLTYDGYFDAFVAGFKSINPDPHSLVPQRYYAAEVNDINLNTAGIDPARSLLVLGMSQLSNLVYRKLADDEQSLFILENFGTSADQNRQILISQDTDYRSLMQRALTLAPLSKGGRRVEKLPYKLHLPNPELLEGVAVMDELVAEVVAAQHRKYNRIDRRMARFWQEILDFFADLNFWKN